VTQQPEGAETDAKTEAGGETEAEALARVARHRERRPRVRDEHVTLAHGAGGSATADLVEDLFLRSLANPALEAREDQALIDVDPGRLAFTTDSFVVSPLEFPGGSIGDLAINGTVNDLAVSGARPAYLSAGFILEEGFAIARLRRIVDDLAAAAAAAGVQVVTGDTKVVGRGKGDGCYINTAGIGVLERPVELGARFARPGDAVLVSGPIGDHGITILLARGDLELEADLESDTAPLHRLVDGLLEACSGVRCLRDATRGGVATVLNEVAEAAGVGIALEETALPIRAEVNGACEVLGLDPLYVACEGRMVIVVDAAEADTALAALRALPEGEQAARIGSVVAESPGMVSLRTQLGGTRVVDTMAGDPLPRIC